MKLRIDDLENKIQYKEFEDFLQKESFIFTTDDDISYFLNLITIFYNKDYMFDSIISAYDAELLPIYKKQFEQTLIDYLFYLFKQERMTFKTLKSYKIDLGFNYIFKKICDKYALTDKDLFLFSLPVIQYKENVLRLFISLNNLTEEETEYFWDVISESQKLSVSFIELHLNKFLTKKRAQGLSGQVSTYQCSATTINLIKKYAC